MGKRFKIADCQLPIFDWLPNEDDLFQSAIANRKSEMMKWASRN
jgi:hypothetical protein